MKELLEVVRTILLDGRVVTPAKPGQAPVIVEADEGLAARWKETGSCRPVAPPAPPAESERTPAPPAPVTGDADPDAVVDGPTASTDSADAAPENTTATEPPKKNPAPPAPPAAPTPRKGGRL